MFCFTSPITIIVDIRPTKAILPSHSAILRANNFPVSEVKPVIFLCFRHDAINPYTNCVLKLCQTEPLTNNSLYMVHFHLPCYAPSWRLSLLRASHNLGTVRMALSQRSWVGTEASTIPDHHNQHGSLQSHTRYIQYYSCTHT